MQLLATLLAAASVAEAHYNFNALVTGTTVQTLWSQIRQRSDYLSHGPVTDVTLLDIRCGKDASTNYAPNILSVAAGSNVTFEVDPQSTGIQHPGPGMGYLAKVPAGKTAANWDGAGAVWFKVWQIGAGFASDGKMTWATDGLKTLTFQIPKATPSGDYLARIEHIGLHAASQTNGAQFYLSCAQITVTGGGSGVPAPLVSFPGAYKATDPGVKIQIYYPLPTNYTIPGPAVWTG